MPVDKTAENTLSLITNTAKDSLADIDKGIKAVKERIIGEKKMGKINASDLQNLVKDTQLKIETIQADIDSSKAQAKKRSQEIEDWNTWYKAQPESEKGAVFQKMTAEIGWRLVEKSGIEVKISSLEMAKHALSISLEKAKDHLNAVHLGLHDMPIEQDPRLKVLLDSKAMIKASLGLANKPKARKKS